VIEYADFQCPACGAFARTVEPQLIEDYVKTGKVTFEHREFPFLDDRASGDESDDASAAAYCAQDQGKFWAMHDQLYYNQEGENEGAFSRERLTRMAEAAGLDVPAFEECMASGEHEDEVSASYDEARAQGLNSTPTFFVDGQVVTGASYPELRDAIEAALANTQ
jgi:protein-disulfide isomerase